MKMRAAFVAGIAGILATACADSPLAPVAADLSSSANLLTVVTASPTVSTEPGNPVCTTTRGGRTGLGYHDGTADLTTVANNTVTVTVSGLGTITYTTNASNTGLTSWSSTFLVDAVIMKGGSQGSQVYAYAGGANAGSNTFTPNNANGRPAGISHVNFCWDGRVVGGDVPSIAPTIVGRGSYDQQYAWTLAKSVNQSTFTDVDAGAAVPVTYTLTSTRSRPTYFGAEASYDVTLRNPQGYNSTVSFTTSPELTCGTTTLEPGESTTCSHSMNLGSDIDDVLVNVTITPTTAGYVSTSVGTTIELELDQTFGATATLNDAPIGVSGVAATGGAQNFNATLTAPTCGQTQTYPNTASVTWTTPATPASASASADVTIASKACVVTPPPMGPNGSGTAFAFGATRFSELSGNGNRWGWVLTVANNATATVDVYGGAGQYNLNTKVGTAVVTHTGNAVTVVATPVAGCTLTGQSVFYSPTMPTRQDVNAPGQYSRKSVALNNQTAYVVIHWNYSCSN